MLACTYVLVCVHKLHATERSRTLPRAWRGGSQRRWTDIAAGVCVRVRVRARVCVCGEWEWESGVYLHVPLVECIVRHKSTITTRALQYVDYG
jgi:hypothetical protein